MSSTRKLVEQFLGDADRQAFRKPDFQSRNNEYFQLDFNNKNLNDSSLQKILAALPKLISPAEVIDLSGNPDISSKGIQSIVDWLKGEDAPTKVTLNLQGIDINETQRQQLLILEEQKNIVINVDKKQSAANDRDSDEEANALLDSYHGAGTIPQECRLI